MTKLNIGCGFNKLDGFVNIDCAHQCDPDMVFDIEWGGMWPWASGEVDEIVATHVLEHVTGLNGVMQEAYRVLAPAGLFRIAVPHPWSDGFIGDPTHVRPITQNTLALFSKAKCAEFRDKGWPNTPLADYLDVDFEIIYQGAKVLPKWQAMKPPSIEYMAAHYVNIIDELTFVLKRV